VSARREPIGIAVAAVASTGAAVGFHNRMRSALSCPRATDTPVRNSTASTPADAISRPAWR
jgi:hypothetical protein